MNQLLMKNNIIISIIIPTYNRYNITKKLITQFINLSDERIENYSYR